MIDVSRETAVADAADELSQGTLGPTALRHRSLQRLGQEKLCKVHDLLQLRRRQLLASFQQFLTQGRTHAEEDMRPRNENKDKPSQP